MEICQDESSIVYPSTNLKRKAQFTPRIKIPLPSENDHMKFSEPLIDYIEKCDRKETILHNNSQNLSNCIIITSAASPTSPNPIYQDDDMDDNEQPNFCVLAIPEPPKVELPPPPPPPKPKRVLRRKLTPSEGPSVAELAKLKEQHKQTTWDILEEVEEDDES